MWLAVDEDGVFWVFNNKPEKDEGCGEWIPVPNDNGVMLCGYLTSDIIILLKSEYPKIEEMTFNDDAIEIELTIKNRANWDDNDFS